MHDEMNEIMLNINEGLLAIDMLENFHKTITEVGVNNDLLDYVSDSGFDVILKREFEYCRDNDFSGDSVEKLSMGSMDQILGFLEKVWEFILNLIARIKELWAKITRQNAAKVKEIDVNLTEIKKLKDGIKDNEVDAHFKDIKMRIPKYVDFIININSVLDGLNLKNGFDESSIQKEPEFNSDPLKSMVDNLGKIDINMDTKFGINKKESKLTYHDLNTQGYDYKNCMDVFSKSDYIVGGIDKGKMLLKYIEDLANKEKKDSAKNPGLSKKRVEYAKTWVNIYARYLTAFGKEGSLIISDMLSLSANLQTILKKTIAEKKNKK